MSLIYLVQLIPGLTLPLRRSRDPGVMEHIQLLSGMVARHGNRSGTCTFTNGPSTLRQCQPAVATVECAPFAHPHYMHYMSDARWSSAMAEIATGIMHQVSRLKKIVTMKMRGLKHCHHLQIAPHSSPYTIIPVYEGIEGLWRWQNTPVAFQA